MTAPVTVRSVGNKKDLRAFLQVPFTVFADDPNWVAPLFFERMEHLDRRKNPYFLHADAQFFVAEKDGKLVGRISAQYDRLRQEVHKDGVGQFGFLDAIDDSAVFSALFKAAEDWLKARGCTKIQGPFTLSINDETGLLVEGFDTPPYMMMGHSKRYYGPRVEEQGFSKAMDFLCYDYTEGNNLPPALLSTFNKSLDDPDIVVRPLDKKNLQRDLDIIITIFNDAWSENWGFVPFTHEEIIKLGKDLKFLITPEYVAIAEYKGEPAAMAVTLPNINEWIAGLNGRLLPFGWLRLAKELIVKRPKTVRMPLMGLRKQFHGSMLGSALTMSVIETVRRYHIARGTTRGELSWILESNPRMRRIIERLNGKPYKTYRAYEKPL